MEYTEVNIKLSEVNPFAEIVVLTPAYQALSRGYLGWMLDLLPTKDWMKCKQ